MSDWQDDYENNGSGVDPNDYSNSDDFFDSLRNAEKNAEEEQRHASSSSGGCYIATCIYGSYDCPKVLTLRKFRDQVLAKHILGQIFIKIYYFLSPKMVWLLSRYEWFHHFWRPVLDRIVTKLKKSDF